jgi:hypothetical protein
MHAETDEDDGTKLKWGWKWKWFVTCVCEQRVHNAFGQGWDSEKRQLKTRATVFGTILQSYHVQTRQKPVFNHIAQKASPMSPVQVFSGRARRTSSTFEFHAEQTETLVDSLKAKYNADQASDVGADLFHTPAALMRRESLQWDHKVVEALNIIWSSSDTDRSGGIDKKEYQNMHAKMYKATHGNLDGWSIKMGNEDWDLDREG